MSTSLALRSGPALEDLSCSEGVDAAHDLGDGRDVLGHEPRRLLAQRVHPLAHRHRPEFLVVAILDDEVLDLVGHNQQLISTDAFLVARVRTEVAPLAVPELLLPGAPRLPVEGQL